MKILRHGAITVFISNDRYREYSKIYENDPDPTPIAEKIVDGNREILGVEFASGGKFWRLIERFATSTKKGIAILDAHGDFEKRKWIYWDGLRIHSVQRWINRHEDKFSCLMIICCNPGHITPRSKKSLLAFADSNISSTTGHEARGEQQHVAVVVHPKDGEIDSYTIDYYLSHPPSPI